MISTSHEDLRVVVIRHWLNQAMCRVDYSVPYTVEDQQKLRLGFKHLWICGPTGMGKSYFVQRISQLGARIFYMNMDEDYQDDYLDDTYDLCVLDEFKGHKRIQWLNRWLDGTPLSIRKKGSQYLKKELLPTIILSNYDIDGCYSKASHSLLSTLARRFVLVNFGRNINTDLGFIPIL